MIVRGSKIFINRNTQITILILLAIILVDILFDLCRHSKVFLHKPEVGALGIRDEMIPVY